MANPNMTVAKAAARRPFDPVRQEERDAARREARKDSFVEWMVSQAKAGNFFVTVQAAEAAFSKATNGQA